MDELLREWLQLQFRVRHLLRNPMLDRKGYSQRLAFCVFPSFEDSYALYLLTSRDQQDTIAIGSQWDRDGDHAVFQSPVERAKHPAEYEATITTEQLSVSGKKLDSLLKMAEDITLPIDPACDRLGFDGVTYELQFGDGFYFSRIQWWVKLPKRWKKLKPLVEKLTKLAKTEFRDNKH